MEDDLMVQQQVRSKWQHMVAVMCLNQTYRKQVKECLPLLFSKWPTPEKMIKAPLRSIQKIIKPLGMWKVRSKRIKEMSRQFLTWDQQDASDLYGIGEYGSDSYKIFYLNKTNIRPKDKELKRYLKEIKNGKIHTKKN
jgi:endonuclease III